MSKTHPIGSDSIDASALSLATVLGCVRAIVRSGRGVLTFPTWSVEIVLSATARTFTWRGLTGIQLGILDVWVEAHRGSTVEGGPIPTTSGVIARAVDVVLRAIDDPKLDLPRLSDYRAVLVEYAETGPQESVCDAVRALLNGTEREHLISYAGVPTRISLSCQASQGRLRVVATAGRFFQRPTRDPENEELRRR